MNKIDAFLPNHEFYPLVTKKRNIVLHHTVSSTAKSALAWWRQSPGRVATAYVIDKDGTVYRAFDDKYWAHHLGLRTRNNTDLNRRSVAIELVNEGYTWPSDRQPGARCWLYPGGPHYTGPLVQPGGQPWRGCNMWPAYTDDQVEACAELVLDILQRHNLPKTLAPAGGFDMAIPDKYTIYTHHNVRQDKTDLSPAFPWGKFQVLLGLPPEAIIL